MYKNTLWKLPLTLLLTGKQLSVACTLENLSRQNRTEQTRHSDFCSLVSVPTSFYCSFS